MTVLVPLVLTTFADQLRSHSPMGNGALQGRVVERLVPLRYTAQYDSGYYLDDLKTIPFVAIVRPMGPPRIERRSQKCGSDPSPTYAITVQKVVLVSGLLGGAKAFNVVAPLYSRGIRPPAGLIALKPGNYLLVGETSRAGKALMAQMRFVNPGARPKPEEFHEVSATASEISGWSLVRTDAVRLPSGLPRDEIVLRALAQAADADAEPGFSSLDVLSRLCPYSFQTAAQRSSRAFKASARLDKVGDLTVDEFVKQALVPALRSAALTRAGEAKVPFLQTLIRWGDHPAEAELNAMRSASTAARP